MNEKISELTTSQGLKGFALFCGVGGVMFFTLRRNIMIIFHTRSLRYMDMDPAVFWFFGIGALFFMFLGLLSLSHVIRGKGMEKIKNYLKEHPEHTMEEIEADFNHAIVGADKIFFGEKWLIFVNASMAMIEEMENVIWVYYGWRNKKGATTHYIYVNTKDNKQHTIGISRESQAEELINMLAASDRRIVTGYSAELKQLYKNNREDFARLAKQAQNI